MEDQQFDELVKTFARPVSRRQMVKVLVATTVGGWFIRAATGEALAQNNACARFCNATFGEGTEAQSQCASDGAHHRGLCYTCGPNSSGGTKPICCPKNASGSCASYDSADCCGQFQNCCNGKCCTLATCCKDATPNYCCLGDCCSGTCCFLGTCCKDASPNYCCAAGTHCSGGICCNQFEFNCNGQCCFGQCCDGKCCFLGTCCTDATPSYCCDLGTVCNGGTCRPVH